MPRRRSNSDAEPKPSDLTRPLLSRSKALAVLALAALLAAAPLVPRGGEPTGTARRTSDGGRPTSPRPTATGPTATGPTATDPTATGAPGTAALTPAMRREIDRVVAEGLAQPSPRGRPDPRALAAQQARCATLEGLTYCLHVGWTDESPASIQAGLATAAQEARRTGPVESTGDLDPQADLTRAARLSPRARAAQERAELTAAAEAVAKLWTIKHEIEGVPYPRGFWARHAEARPTSLDQAHPATGSAGLSARTSSSPSPSAAPAKRHKTIQDYPRKDTVLDPQQTREQVRSYWCGPTSTQMIVWGWTGKKRTQRHWAGRLGTTSSGTAITSITSVINRDTGWDNKSYAGPYLTLDVKGYTYGKWYLLLARHIHDYQAPLVLHPILLQRYFPYLDDDASGHYQVGRGYFTRKDGVRMISYFEPWNQRRFDPSEPFIDRVQWQKAYRSYRANLAHPYHNIGV